MRDFRPSAPNFLDLGEGGEGGTGGGIIPTKSNKTSMALPDASVVDNIISRLADTLNLIDLWWSIDIDLVNKQHK